MNRPGSNSLLAIIILVAVLSSCRNDQYLLIRGATIIDLSDGGRCKSDIDNSFLLIKDSIIIDFGSGDKKIRIPNGCREIDARGKYIIPGLIDGFGTINNQAYADAYLDAGVSSIIGVISVRRGDLFFDADPGPEIFLLGEVGEYAQTDEEIRTDFIESKNEGCDVMLLMYKLMPSQLKLSLELADSLDMAVIGELGYTSYEEALSIGLKNFVHITRYSLDNAPADMRKKVAEEPFGSEMDSPKWDYYRFLNSLNTSDSDFLSHAKNFAEGGAFLMPTLSLLYLDLPGHRNPWKDKLTEGIDSSDINNPASKSTGDHDYDSVYQKAYAEIALKQLELQKTYVAAGTSHLAGSGTDVWGTMPGFSLHTELELMHKAGLSNRMSLAAATINFSDAFGWKRGKIEKGYYADLLLLNANPLDSLANLRDIYKMLIEGKEIHHSN
jgi:hypothetical protein